MTPESAKSDRKPLPRYAMPDGSEPEYGAILEQIQNYRKSMIGSSFFYIQARPGKSPACAGSFPAEEGSFSTKSLITRSTEYRKRTWRMR